MVCEKCEKKLSKVIVPDKWKEGASNTNESGGRKINENKLLSKKNSLARQVIILQICATSCLLVMVISLKVYWQWNCLWGLSGNIDDNMPSKFTKMVNTVTPVLILKVSAPCVVNKYWIPNITSKAMSDAAQKQRQNH
ncbi:hypothetical protein Scep_028724 [Stephania cephalantha]|uniref:Cysteine-rich PDZ-binding protein n=1 Tax=Stephania cephalantha TaxID=152367 RepID=A0AAP0EF27_9MAGN